MSDITAYITNFYDQNTGTYKPIPAFKGEPGFTPHIENERWYCGTTDTGIYVNPIWKLSYINMDGAYTTFTSLCNAIAASNLQRIPNRTRISDTVSFTDTPSQEGEIKLDIIRQYSSNNVLETVIYGTFKSPTISPYEWTCIWNYTGNPQFVKDWSAPYSTPISNDIEMVVEGEQLNIEFDVSAPTDPSVVTGNVDVPTTQEVQSIWDTVITSANAQ